MNTDTHKETIYIKFGGFVATILCGYDYEMPYSLIKRLALDEMGVQIEDNDTWELVKMARSEKDRREKFPSRKFPVHHAELRCAKINVGESFQTMINQGLRSCEVLAVTKSRYRIEFEMPNCTQQGWRKGYKGKDGCLYRVWCSK